MNHYRGVTEDTWDALALWERYCLVAATLNLTIPWEHIKWVSDTISRHWGKVVLMTVEDKQTTAQAVHSLLENTKRALPLETIETICTVVIARAYDIDIEMTLGNSRMGGFTPRFTEQITV